MIKTYQNLTSPVRVFLTPGGEVSGEVTAKGRAAHRRGPQLDEPSYVASLPAINFWRWHTGKLSSGRQFATPIGGRRRRAARNARQEKTFF